GANASYRQQLIHGIGHWLGRIDFHRLNDNGSYQGLAVGDVNGDGLEDLYVLQPGGLPNRLFVQQADGTALDTSAAAGVDWWTACHAALFVDLDNDGD
ncbi:MAG: VCBS repeat-containing protein, partial [Planctomycetes bacterium]|nr:VCBS repeat-containing protein [Planctomycetota bacterium]